MVNTVQPVKIMVRIIGLFVRTATFTIYKIIMKLREVKGNDKNQRVFWWNCWFERVAWCAPMEGLEARAEREPTRRAGLFRVLISTRGDGGVEGRYYGFRKNLD